MKSQDKLGAFFKEELHNHTEEISQEELEAISQFISRKSFFRFNYRSFNIYYAGAIVCAFFLTIFFAAHYMYSGNTSAQERPTGNAETNKSVIIPDSNSAAISEKPAIVQQNKETNKNSFHKEDLKSANNFIFVDTLRENESAVKQVVPVNQLTDEKPATDLPKELIKPVDSTKVKKTVVIVRKDTIYQLDTVRRKTPDKWKKK